VQADALEYLESQRDRLGGIFFSHVIEHLAPSQVVEFLSLARRALRPGGRLIIVTPNVADVWTMTELFWLDTTHVRPYPILLLKKLCEEASMQPIASGSYGLGWRSTGRRRVLQYFWRRLVWGKQYGRTEAYIVTQA
jgi:predicted SAM-dependent methyltransferase